MLQCGVVRPSGEIVFRQFALESGCWPRAGSSGLRVCTAASCIAESFAAMSIRSGKLLGLLMRLCLQILLHVIECNSWPHATRLPSHIALKKLGLVSSGSFHIQAVDRRDRRPAHKDDIPECSQGRKPQHHDHEHGVNSRQSPFFQAIHQRGDQKTEEHGERKREQNFSGEIQCSDDRPIPHSKTDRRVLLTDADELSDYGSSLASRYSNWNSSRNWQPTIMRQCFISG